VRVGLLVVGWLIIAVLGLVAMLRLVAWDSAEPLIALNASPDRLRAWFST